MSKHLLNLSLLFGLTIFFSSHGTVYADPPARFIESRTGIELVLLKGGTFTMGDITEAGNASEQPLHQVEVPTFYMGKTEVTFDQFHKFSNAFWRKKPSDNGMGQGNKPVINVSWEQAVAFTKWLSKKSGQSFRLPTEAEWEYAARTGTRTTYWWGNKFMPGYANCKDCAAEEQNGKTTPAGTFPPSPWGLYDMLGNVYEWTLDDRHRNYIGAPTDGSAWTEKESNSKINRGGSFLNHRSQLRVSARDWERAANGHDSLGFRVVMEVQ